MQKEIMQERERERGRGRCLRWRPCILDRICLNIMIATAKANIYVQGWVCHKLRKQLVSTSLLTQDGCGLTPGGVTETKHDANNAPRWMCGSIPGVSQKRKQRCGMPNHEGA
jgi:hypothetical protein